MYGEGISREGNILDVGVNSDIVNKAGSWYSYGEHRLGQGRENSKEFLKDNPEIANEIDRKIREENGLIDKVEEEKVEENKETDSAKKDAPEKKEEIKSKDITIKESK